jgi:hypothetical protein
LELKALRVFKELMGHEEQLVIRDLLDHKVFKVQQD